MIMLPSCQIDFNEINKDKMSKEEAVDAINVLKKKNADIFNSNKLVILDLSMEDVNENTIAGGMVTFELHRKDLMLVFFSQEAAEIGFLKPYYSSTPLAISAFKNQAVVLFDNYVLYNVSKVYSADVHDYYKLFDFDLDVENYDVYRRLSGKHAENTCIYDYYFESLGSNPLKNIVLDNCDIEYFKDSYRVRLFQNGIEIKVKINYEGNEMWLSLVYTMVEQYEEQNAVLGLLSFIDSRHKFESFSQWPDYYKDELKATLGNFDVPCPSDVPMFNDLWCSTGSCYFSAFDSSIDFLHAYENMLNDLGYKHIQYTDIWYKLVGESNNRLCIQLWYDDVDMSTNISYWVSSGSH